MLLKLAVLYALHSEKQNSLSYVSEALMTGSTLCLHSKLAQQLHCRQLLCLSFWARKQKCTCSIDERGIKEAVDPSTVEELFANSACTHAQ